MSDKQRRTRRQFTAEFKRDAVELVRTSGRPIAVIARELGIYDSTLGNWVRQDRIDRGEQEGSRARSGRGWGSWSARPPGCGWSVTCSNEPSPSGQGTVDAVMRYRCVDAQKAAGFPVAAACQAAEVSRAAYYAWVARAEGLNANARRPGWSVRSAASTLARAAPTVSRGCTPSSGGAAGW